MSSRGFFSMLEATFFDSPAALKKYFSGSLGATYYLDSAEGSRWVGELAKKLGLSGVVTKQAFHRLCDNLHPDHQHEPLTPRTKTNRIPGVDITFNPPKAFTIAVNFEPSADRRAALEQAVNLAIDCVLAEMEKDVSTRVRRDGRDENRTTGNFVCALIQHEETRPIEGRPDAQRHYHVIVFNATNDPSEGRCKAIQFRTLIENMPRYQAIFHAELAMAVERMVGYETEPHEGSFRIKGIPQSLEAKFSRRSALINQKAEELGITDPAKKARLGAKTREPKGKPASLESLREEWRTRITPEEWESLRHLTDRKQREASDTSLEAASEVTREASKEVDRLGTVARELDAAKHNQSSPSGNGKHSFNKTKDTGARDRSTERPGNQVEPDVNRSKDRTGLGADRPAKDTTGERGTRVNKDAVKALSRAAEELFERQAVITEDRLLTRALKLGIGCATLTDLRVALERSQFIRRVHEGQKLVTTHEVLREERDVVALAQKARGRHFPLNPYWTGGKARTLTLQQRTVVRQLLNSTNGIDLLVGFSGSGKTETLRALKAGILARGAAVEVFAPTAEASRGRLKEGGFKRADTVARLLVDPKVQDRCRRGVIFIDEAPLIGTRTLKALFQLSSRLSSRLILIGDPGQHQSIERGGTFHLLEHEAGLKPARLVDILRQWGRLKAVVGDLAEHKTQKAFEKLDRHGAILDLPTQKECHRRIAVEYLDTAKTKKSVIVVIPTHGEGQAFTQELRNLKRDRGELGRDRSFRQLKPIHATEVERRDASLYKRGQVLQFHKHARWGFESFKAGERWKVAGVDPFGNVLVRSGFKLRAAPLRLANRWQVYESSKIHLAKGDVIRITRNGKSEKPILGKKRHPLNNGSLHRVKGFTPSGDLRLDNGWVVDRKFAHLAHGYYHTSFGAQSKGVDKVIAGICRASFPAASPNQFYVTVSRAKTEVLIVTDDKTGLRHAVVRKEDRVTAMQIAKDVERVRHPHLTKYVQHGIKITREVFGEKLQQAREAFRRVHERNLRDATSSEKVRQ
jgi:conjugative relaxase-like TrwC/TraI family protein